MTSNFIPRSIPALGKYSQESLYRGMFIATLFMKVRKQKQLKTSKNCIWVNCVFVQANTYRRNEVVVYFVTHVNLGKYRAK